MGSRVEGLGGLWGHPIAPWSSLQVWLQVDNAAIVRCVLFAVLPKDFGLIVEV